MTVSNNLVNSWIFLNEDEPSGTNYNSPDSSYQTLIQSNVYQSVDILFICFAETLPTSPTTIPAGNGTSYTLQMGGSAHSDGLTNQDYMNYVIRDARANNPGISICMTLNYGNGNELSQIFPDPNNPDQESADNFAQNLVSYMEYYGINGFDIDWEAPIGGETTQQQFKVLFTAIGEYFDQNDYYLTLSPAGNNYPNPLGNLDIPTVNQYFSFVNIQLYGGLSKQMCIDAGMSDSLLAYGALFESNSQTAQDAYQGFTEGNYNKITSWRLNSGNYQFEQQQQIILHGLVYGS